MEVLRLGVDRGASSRKTISRDLVYSCMKEILLRSTHEKIEENMACGGRVKDARGQGGVR